MVQKAALKMVPVATLLGSQHYEASTGISSHKHHTTKIAHLTKSLIIINVFIHWRTVWKTGIHPKICYPPKIKKLLLAHLSPRLIGELIVYTGIRRPSVRPSTFSNDISSEAVRRIHSIFHI